MLFLDGENVSIDDIKGIAVDDKQVAIKAEALLKVSSCYEFLSDFSANHLLYGINTGFGPMAQFKIDENKQIELQYNLIRSHATGFGPWLGKCASKAVLATRINSLIRGESGIKPELITLMVSMCNRNIVPLIPTHGGVGASGDLVQLAHLALGIIGEGEVYYKGNVVKASQAFELEKIEPYAISLRDGIALLNGTSAMTGLASLNLGSAKIALEWMIIFSSMINEIMEAYNDHFSAELNNTKKHAGQKKVAAAMRDIIKGSQLIRSRADHWQLEQSHNFFKEKVQEYYSIRCVPQILGPVYDTLQYALFVIENELNSTSDNPVTIFSEKTVFHGGNFHGDYVSLEMDKVKLVATKLSMLAERQLNYLLNHNINRKLPAFLNLLTPGLNFGLQGMQFTATSTTSENQTLSTSSYIHSIPNNNDNQDIVSMGFNSANLASKIIENTFEVITIESIAILQAIDALEFKQKLSPFNQKIYTALREIFPVIKTDRIMYTEQQRLKEFLMVNDQQIINLQSN